MEHLTVMDIMTAMVKNNPNDQELGKAIRKFMVQLEQAKQPVKEDTKQLKLFKEDDNA